ncbi:CvpA family protein [bacterium]|nr:CvpA family protein [bacterium]
MNWADWTIVAIVGISSLISIARGFVKEAISLAIWFFALFIPISFHERLAVLLETSIESVSIRYILSFVILFVATFMVGAMIKRLMSQIVDKAGLTVPDRLLGIAFGVGRGILIVMLILILVPMAIPIQQDGWWQESRLIPEFLLVEQWCKDTFAALWDWVGHFSNQVQQSVPVN